MKIFFQAITIFIIVVLISCNNDDFCLSNQQSVQALFYSSETNEDSTVSDVTILPLSTNQGDTVYNAEEISESFLPLSMMSDTTGYVIQILNQKDTIRFVHSKELDFISEECGFIFKFELDTILFTNISFIDSVSIEYPSIEYNESATNVKIYLY